MRDQIGRQTNKPHKRFEYEQNSIFIWRGNPPIEEDYKTRDRDLCRRANAVLLVLKDKTKSEVANLLQAGRSSLNRWLKWYDVAGVVDLKTKGIGRPVRQNRDFICGVLKILLKYTPRTLEYRVVCAATEQVMQYSDPQFNNQTLVAQSRNCLAASCANALYPRPR